MPVLPANDPLGILSKSKKVDSTDPLNILKKNDGQPLKTGGQEQPASTSLTPSPSQSKSQDAKKIGGLGSQFNPASVVKEAQQKKEAQPFSFSKEAEPVNADAIRNYENAQQFYSLADKEKAKILNANKHSIFSPIPLIEDVAGAIFPGYAKEQKYKTAMEIGQADIVLASAKKKAFTAQDAIKNEIPKVLKPMADNWAQYVNTTVDNVPKLDEFKIAAFAKKVAAQYGVPETGMFYSAIKREANNLITQNLIKPELEKTLAIKYKQQTGRDLSVDMKSESNQAALKLEELKKGAVSKQKNIQNEIFNGARGEVAAMSSDITTQVNALNDEIKVAADAITNKYSTLIKDNKFIGSQEEFAQYQQDFAAIQQKENENKKAFESINKSYLDAQNLIYTKANSRYNREAQEVAKITQAEYEKFKPKANPKMQATIEKLYGESYNEVLDKNQVLRQQSAAKNSIFDNLKYNILSSLGGQIKGWGEGANLANMATFGEYLQNSFAQDVPDFKSAKDYLDLQKDAKWAGQIIGGILPGMAAAAAVTAATGGGAAPIGFQMVSQGLAQWATETYASAGNMKADVYAATGDIAAAQNAERQTIEFQKDILPLYAFSGLPFIGKPISKMISKAVPSAVRAASPTISRLAKFAENKWVAPIIGGTLETAEELPQEYSQNLSEEAIRKEGNYKNMFDYHTKEKLENTALNIAPMFLFGAAGEVFGQSDETKKQYAVQQAAKAFALKTNFAELAPGQKEQFLFDVIQRQGAPFAAAYLTSAYGSGQMDKATFEGMQQTYAKQVELLGKTEELGLTPVQAKLFNAFSTYHENEKERFNNETDPILKTIAAARMTEYETALTNISLKKEPDYSVVTYPDNTQMVFMHSELENSLNYPAFAQAVANGDIKVAVFGQSEKLNKKIEDTTVAVVAAQKEEKKLAKQQEVATKKEIAATFNVEIEDNVGDMGVDVNGLGTEEQTEQAKQALRDAGIKIRQDDTEDISGLPSQVGEGQELVPIESQQGTGAEATGTGGVLQTQGVGGQVQGVGQKILAPVSVSNKTELAGLEERTQSDKNKSAVLESAKKAVATLKSVFPDMDIFIHEDANAYNQTMTQLDGNENSRGNFAFERDENDVPTGNGRIDINLSNASETTIAHEVTHAVLLKAFGDSPATFKQFRDRISPILRADLNKELLAFEDMYKGKAVAPEEYLTQLSALLSKSAETVEYKPSTLRKIAAVINEFVAKITGGKLQPFKGEVDFKNFVDFLNQMAQAIEKGENIENINDLGVSGIISSTGTKSKSSLSSGEIKRFPVNENVKVEEDVPMSKFNGKQSNLIESDRMTGGFIADSKGNPLFKFYGGVFYPIITGKWWASRNITKAKAIAENGNKNRDADGYVYCTPMIGSDKQHMSNTDMLSVTVELMKLDVNDKKSKVKKSDVIASIEKAFNRKDVQNKKGLLNDILKKSNNINEIFDELEYALFQEGDKVLDRNGNPIVDKNGETISNFTFEERLAIVNTILGDPKVKDVKFPSAGTISDAAKRFEEPITSKVNAIGDVVTVMRTKGTLQYRKTENTDPFYHKSYPVEIYAVDENGNPAEIEVYILDGAYGMKETFPSLTQSSGKEFSWSEYIEKHKSENLAVAQYNRTAKLSSATGEIKSKAQLPEQKNISNDEDIVSASVNVAPLYSTKVSNIEQAAQIHNSDFYQEYKKENERIAGLFNLKVESQLDGIGGYEFSNGKAVREATTIVNVTGKFSDIVNYAATIGALAPEVQDATIAGMYVEKGSKNHTADKVEVKIDNNDAALKAVADAGFDRAGFTLVNGEISFFNVLDYPTTDFYKKIDIFEKKYNEYGGKIIDETTHAVRSEYIDNLRRKDIIAKIESEGIQYGQDRAGLRDALATAKERNTTYTTWKYLDKSESVKEYRILRQKQFDLASEGKSLSDKDAFRIGELEKRLSKILSATFKSESSIYDKAKLEVDAIAEDVAKLIEGGFRSEFPVKRPSRAAIKSVRWYDVQPNLLGDGARTNIIVNTDVDADYLFNEIDKRFSSDLDRKERENTELGYPKRLIEIRTRNGKTAEIQVITPQGYLAKDGVSRFPKDAKEKAQQSLQEVRDRLGWQIPDGVGHYFYEINRDLNIQKNLRDQAKEISIKYYDAFLNTDSKLSDAEFRKDISEFKQKIDTADKSKWDEGNTGESPDSLNKYLRIDGDMVSKAQLPEQVEATAKALKNVGKNTRDKNRIATDAGLIIHAGESKIDKLDTSKAKGGVRGIYGKGIYFSDSPDKAADYGGEFTYLDKSKLSIIDTRQKISKEFIDSIKEASKKVEEQGSSIRAMRYDMFADKLKAEINGEREIDNAWKNVRDRMQADQSDTWNALLKDLGYDTIKNGYEYVVFDADKGNAALVKDSNAYIAEAYHKGDNPQLTKSVNKALGVSETPTTVASKSQLPQQIKKLRAEEQAELDSKIDNAEQYRVDGKVDRDKLTKKEDIKAFDEVYNKYDKLITPLLKEGVGEVEAKKALEKYPELKDTKAVDKNGNPLLVYHGGIKFDDFNPSQNKNDKGIYFTENKDFAEYFAHQAEIFERDKRGDDYSDIPEELLSTGDPFPEKYFKYAKIHSAYLDIKNPTIVDGIDAKDIPKNYEPNTDGFIAKSTGDFGYKGGQYVVFEPSQIKKAELPQQKGVGEGEAKTTMVSKSQKDKVDFGVGEEGKDNKKEFDKLTSTIPNSGEVTKYLSGETIEKYEGEKPRNEQEVLAQQLKPALERGVDIIEKAKELFGEKYIETLLQYVETENLPPANKALIYVSLENEVAKQKIENPSEAAKISKMQDLVRAKSQAFLRSNSLAINMGRLRKFAEVGYDVNKLTDRFFSSREMEDKKKIEAALQTTADDINKEAERIITDEENVKAKVEEGVKEEIQKIYENLSTEKKKTVDKRLSVLDKMKQKIFNKYTFKSKPQLVEGSLKSKSSVSNIIEEGYNKIFNAMKAGVEINKAINIGVEKIKEEIEKTTGQKWADEVEFKKDMVEAFKAEGLIEGKTKEKSQEQILQEQQRKLEAEINRQLSIVLKLKEKLARYESGNLEETDVREQLKDVPEIEGLKQKVKEAQSEYNKKISEEKRMLDNIEKLQKELERVKNRIEKTPKEKTSEVKQLSDEEKALVAKIKEANEAWAKEKESASKLEKQYRALETERNRQLERVSILKEKLDALKRGEKPQKNAQEVKLDTPEIEALKADIKKEQKRLAEAEAKKEKTIAERLEEAKARVMKQIESIKEQIANKQRVQKRDELKPDAALENLMKQRDALNSLLDKYVPKVDAYADERNAKAAKTKLENEILELNRQIQKGEKDKVEKKESKERAELDNLRAEKEARQSILEALDPTPKLFIENTLIEQGFGRQINVKTKDGVEKRWVLDWKKLAGEEGSVDNIRERVESALIDKGFSDEQILRMQDAFVEEYNNLSESIIEKALNEINARNKQATTPEQKSAVRKLVEMYNYGLFNEDPSAYETALAKTVGITGVSLDNFERVRELGEVLSNLFNSNFEGKPLNESQLRTAIQVIEEKMRTILNSEAMQQGGNAFRLSEIVKGYFDASQRMMLNTVKQGMENPISGLLERFYSSIGYAGTIPEQLNAQQRKMARDIYKEMVLQKGMGYGNVGNAFISKGSLDAYVHNMSDSQLVQGIMSVAMGKTILDAVDSAYKAKITQQKFTYNLISILTRDRMVNGKLEKGMSKEEAKRYVAEKISGQSFEDAQDTAFDIIDKINTQAGKKIFNDSPEFISRLATDIVNAALVNGEKITAEMVTAAYNAAYKAAGRGLGHVANNFISEQINTQSGKLESKISEAIKQKDFKKAIYLNYFSIFYRNIANPFVGGGTNWIVLKAEKTGLGLLSGLMSMYKDRGTKIDLMSETGIKELEDAMYNSMKTKDKFIRGAVGGAITILAFMLIKGTGADDEYEKWIKKNQWAKKYIAILTPEIALAMLAAKSKGAYTKYLESSFNKNEAFDKGKMAIKAASYLSAGETEKAAGQAGQLVGASIGNPVPWRLVRDAQQVWVGATGGEPYAVNPTPSNTFMEGYLKGGFVDYLGYAPTSEDKSTIVSKDVLESPGYKIYKDREIKMPKIGSIGSYNVPMDAAHPEKTMTPEEFSKFSDLVKSYELNGWEEVNENGKTETHYGLKEIPGVTWKIKEKGMITEEVATGALSNEELQNKVNQLHGDAVEKAKQDLGLAPIKKTRRRITSL